MCCNFLAYGYLKFNIRKVNPKLMFNKSKLVHNYNYIQRSQIYNAIGLSNDIFLK